MPLLLRLHQQLILYGRLPRLHHELFTLSSPTANYVQPCQSRLPKICFSFSQNPQVRHYFPPRDPLDYVIYRMLFNVNGQETFILTTELPTHAVLQSFLIHVSITHILILLRILLAAFLPLQSKLMIIIYSWLIFTLQTLTLTAGNFFHLFSLPVITLLSVKTLILSSTPPWINKEVILHPDNTLSVLYTPSLLNLI